MTETEYDKIWKRMRDELNVKASDYVPQMYNALIQDGYTPKEARDKIKKDCFNIWKVETIDKWIPQEAKQEIKIIAGQKGGLAKSENRQRIVLDSPSSKNQDSDISLTDEEIKRIAETEDVNSPRNVEKQDTTPTKDVDERTQEIEIIHLTGTECGNHFMSMLQKKNYWKYADNVAFEWNKTKKTLRLILN